MQRLAVAETRAVTAETRLALIEEQLADMRALLNAERTAATKARQLHQETEKDLKECRHLGEDLQRQLRRAEVLAAKKEAPDNPALGGMSIHARRRHRQG